MFSGLHNRDVRRITVWGPARIPYREFTFKKHAFDVSVCWIRRDYYLLFPLHVAWIF